MQCDERIAAQSELASIEDQIQQLLAYRQKLEARLSPVFWIPVEVLSVIFELAASFSNPPELATAHSRAQTILTLSHVNQRFRHVALSTPSLWAHVNIPELRSRSLFLALLNRSKACPLTVGADISDLQDSEVEDALTLLSSEARRWKSFQLLASNAERLSMESALSTLNELLAQQELEYLEVLEISARSTPPSSVVRKAFQCPSVPNLRYLRLDAAGIDWASASFPKLQELSLSNLTGLACPSPTELCQLLRATTGLKKLTLNSLHPHISPSLDESVVVAFSDVVDLLELEVLSTENTNLHLVRYLLSHTFTPNVRHLKVGPHVDGPSTSLLDWSTIFSAELNQLESFEWTTGSLARHLVEEVNNRADSQAFLSAIIPHVYHAEHFSFSGCLPIHILTNMTCNPAQASMTLPIVKTLSFSSAKDSLQDICAYIGQRGSAYLRRVETLSVDAVDVTLPRSAGQRALEDIDFRMDWLRANVDLHVRDFKETGFRFAFLGWKDCLRHDTRGRSREYDQEMEE